jgi:hypothetical protein
VIKQSEDVDRFVEDLDHGRKDEIETIRHLIRSANPELTEQIKWNAPSFCVDGDDRITLRLQPRDRVQLIFHRGVYNDAFIVDERSRGDALIWLLLSRAWLGDGGRTVAA